MCSWSDRRPVNVKPRLTRKAAALARVLPTFAFSYEENAARRKWKTLSPRSCWTNHAYQNPLLDSRIRTPWCGFDVRNDEEWGAVTSPFCIVYTYSGGMCLGCKWGGDNNGGRLGFWGSLPHDLVEPPLNLVLYMHLRIFACTIPVFVYTYTVHTHTHACTRAHTHKQSTVLPSSLSISFSILCVNVYTCVICVSMNILCVWVFFLCLSRHCWFSRKFWSPCPVFADKNLSRTTL